MRLDFCKVGVVAAVALAVCAAMVVVGCEGAGGRYGSGGLHQSIVPEGGNGDEYSRSTRDGNAARARGGDDLDLSWLGSGDELWVIERGESWEQHGRVDRDGVGGLRARAGRGDTRALPLDGVRVRADLVGFVGSVSVKQTFVNPWDDVIEAEYVFPLIDDAAVTGFVMEISGRRIRAVVREREEAAYIYEAAKRAGRRAALLTQERANVFAQRVANIGPRERVDIEITYFHTLRQDDGELEFVVPMVVAPRYKGGALARGGGVGGVWSIDVTIDAGAAVEGVRCLSHDVEIEELGGDRVGVRLADQGGDAWSRDFVLRYRVAGEGARGNMVVWEDREGAGYFALSIHPPTLDSESSVREPVEVVFVVDTSGSMEGKALRQAKRVVRGALDALGEGDAFRIVRFAERAERLGGGVIEYDGDSARRAVHELERYRARGGTEMLRGLDAALSIPHDLARRRVVVLVTDGLVGEEEKVVHAVEEGLGGARVIAVGIGDSPNRLLIERVARVGRGGSAYVGLADDARGVGSRVMGKVADASVTDVVIDWGGLGVADVLPSRVGDLYAGRSVVVTGRLEGGRSVDGETVWVRGRRSGGGRIDIPVRVDVRTDSPGRRVLGTLWARAAIMDLTERAIVTGRERYMREVEELALSYGLASARTAFVVADGVGRGRRGSPRRVEVPTRVERGEEWER